jgi:hypothetical protein
MESLYELIAGTGYAVILSVARPFRTRSSH